MLSRLEHFALGETYQSTTSSAYDFITPLLSALNPDKLRHLSLLQIDYAPEKLHNLFVANPKLGTNLTHLTLKIGRNYCENAFGMTVPLLSLIVGSCPGLKYFHFNLVDKRRVRMNA